MSENYTFTVSAEQLDLTIEFLSLCRRKLSDEGLVNDVHRAAGRLATRRLAEVIDLMEEARKP